MKPFCVFWMINLLPLKVFIKYSSQFIGQVSIERLVKRRKNQLGIAFIFELPPTTLNVLYQFNHFSLEGMANPSLSHHKIGQNEFLMYLNRKSRVAGNLQTSILVTLRSKYLLNNLTDTDEGVKKKTRFLSAIKIGLDNCPSFPNLKLS